MASQKNLAISALVLIAIVISGFLVYINFQKPFTGNVESLTLGIYPSEYTSLIFIANDQNYFSANGLNVVMKDYLSGSSAVAGMLNGEIDIATASEYVLATNVLKNSDICAFGTVSKYLNVYLAVRTDQGINTPSDLVGKRIGVSIGTSNQFFLGRFLISNGINESQVTFVNLNFAETPNAIANGTVEAAVANPPYTGQIQNLLGSKTLLWQIQSDQFGYFEAICTKDWASANPDLIVRFLKALVQAEDFNTNHQDQAMELVAKDLNRTNSYITSVWPDYQYAVALDQSFVLLLQEEARWIINNDLSNATSIPDFLNNIYTQGLKSVDPSSVNIVGLGD